jgi:hypothetical protein
MIDIQEKKRKIVSFLKENGPSLPVRIAKSIEMDPVFASAILSELLSAKEIKMSHMKVGASPLYLLLGQEEKLEEQTEHLKSAEKEAYLKLKKEKLLEDESEEPAIRVALRNLKDFAIPFKFKEKIMWKYAFTLDEEIEKLLDPQKKETKEETVEEIPKAWEAKKDEIRQIKEDKKEIVEKKEIVNIFEEKVKQSSHPKTFLKRIEDFLENENTKIISLEEVDKKRVTAKILSETRTALLFAFNKKRINEEELMKCYKKAKDSNLPYRIIVLGELTKKINETMDAYKKLIRVDRLDNE